ncbi:alpha/beta fold hydrolase [Chitinophaga oryziterrae]|uniref:Alpha/beta fold hydrolase n=1 Tax=Chitinophaga oryziterrae TaxID=1031224 RepID=A0A6N8JER6_9BACT|nr:alpha/beta hydrolase [Chitinophaga oryziterrae]MVT43464.1 alpha/beta fold hydrolase [Chitinophaga oryziterrae]
MKTYDSNNAWKLVNKLLPADFQLNENTLPLEEEWIWKGNKMHLDRYPNSASKYRIFLHHGVGTNGRLLNMIFGHKMAELGYDVVAMDNLGYGMTEVNQKNITYEDWVISFSDFVNAETKRDYKKPILYGLSAGGMITYNAACYMDEVYGIIGMCFLDNAHYQVINDTSKYKHTAWFAFPFLGLLSKTPLRTMGIPMKAVSKMNHLVNHKEALKILLHDSASGGASVQTQFLASYASYRSPIAVTAFDKCPILLTQPEKDGWTPIELSKLSMAGIKAPFSIKTLKGAGHYPMEEQGLKQLIIYANEFISRL